MANELLYPYAYCDRLKDYVAPDDPRVEQHTTYKVGERDVYLRVPKKKRRHFYDPNSKGGASGGGGGPECAAHIFAKKFYKQRMFFSATINKQSILVRFETCVLEQRLDNRTPDLVATVLECWPPFIPRGERFLIEIHAHNPIDNNAGRREALERIGAPCIEVHLTKTVLEWKFDPKRDPDSERKRFENYMTTMLTAPFNARWIVPNPAPKFKESIRSMNLMASQDN